jgi:hypothetical protein
MVTVQSFEPPLSQIELRVLRYLGQHWPAATTVTPNIMPTLASEDRAAFVNSIQALNDNGMVSYEAFVMETGSSVRFVETMITARGRAALRDAQLVA